MSIPPPQDGSIALVTGASSGIGEQFARQLSARGHRVALVARRERRLAELARELGGEDRAVPIAADLSVSEERDRLASRLEELGVQVEVLVNNAGYGIYRSFAETGRERELAHLRLLVEAVVDLMARYLPPMGAAGTRGGHQHVFHGRSSSAPL
jgi:short-subunit dehydrogenase